MCVGLQTHQFVGYIEEDVHGDDAVGAVLPLAVHHHARLLLKPRQVVVRLPVIQRVAGGCGRGLHQCVAIQLVAIVTDADLELDWRVDWVDHGGREKSSVELVLVPTKVRLQQKLKVLVFKGPKPSQ